MPRLSPILTLLVASMLLLSSGCAIATKGMKQQVSIDSSPSGAVVLVDGKQAGITPMVTQLPRKKSHSVEVRKDGFGFGRAIVLAQPNEYAKRWIRFGIDIDLGATNDLEPSVVNLNLLPNPLSKTIYGNAFERMLYSVIAVDTLQESGSISSADHRYMIAKIIEHHSSKTP